jgi:hypothetical protein
MQIPSTVLSVLGAYWEKTTILPLPMGLHDGQLWLLLPQRRGTTPCLSLPCCAQVLVSAGGLTVACPPPSPFLASQSPPAVMCLFH